MNPYSDQSVNEETAGPKPTLPKENENLPQNANVFEKSMPDFSFELGEPAKSNGVTEKFILELLSLPETPASGEKLDLLACTAPARCNASEFSHENTDMSNSISKKDSVSPVSVTEPLVLEISGLEGFSSVCKKEQSLVGMSKLAEGDFSAGSLSPEPSSSVHDDTDLRTSSSLNGPVFKDVRTRRRREFHKIHTRRSRAKLNEKMDLLRRILPEPPAGVVVKSKAQIIDYAIRVLARLPLDEIRAEGERAKRCE